MNTRTIWVANQKTQQKYKLNSSATTLGELQDELTGMGIDYTGMSFTEGLSRLTLIDRGSQLPTTVMRNGQPTSDLVILLTNTTKNIASGSTERTRKEAYAVISEMGDSAKSFIKERFGRNYTQVATDCLWEFIDDALGNEEKGEEEKEEVNTATPEKGVYAPNANTVNWLYDGVKSMVSDNLFCVTDIDVLIELLQEFSARLKEEHPSITEDEVSEILNSL